MSEAELVLLLTLSSIGGAIAITAIVVSQWRATREAAYNARLKQLMIERGMSAEEIERVVQARSPDAKAPFDPFAHKPCKPRRAD